MVAVRAPVATGVKSRFKVQLGTRRDSRRSGRAIVQLSEVTRIGSFELPMLSSARWLTLPDGETVEVIAGK